MKNNLFFIILLITTLISGFLIVNKLSKSDFLTKFNFEFQISFDSIANFAKNLNEQNLDPKDYSTDTNLDEDSQDEGLGSITEDIQEDEVNLDNIEDPIPTATPKPKASSFPTQKPKKVNSQPLICNRFTVPHLDGSSSTLCYSNADFNSLQSLNSRLISAKSNYSFEKSVYEMYQKAYESHNSDIYLEPIAKAKKNMQKYQDQIGEISLQMYNIESRGY